jgi:hypothetical protein
MYAVAMRAFKPTARDLVFWLKRFDSDADGKISRQELEGIIGSKAFEVKSRPQSVCGSHKSGRESQMKEGTPYKSPKKPTISHSKASVHNSLRIKNTISRCNSASKCFDKPARFTVCKPGNQVLLFEETPNCSHQVNQAAPNLPQTSGSPYDNVSYYSQALRQDASKIPTTCG